MTLNDVTLQDPNDRDSSDRLTIGSVQADITLASLWSGHPEITELVIDRPVLQRAAAARTHRPREIAAAAAAASSGETERGGVTIDRVTVTDGAIVFSNLRDRVDNRIEGINADAVIGADRNVKITGSARAGDQPLKFDDQGDDARAADRAAEHSGRTHARCARPVAGAAVGARPRCGSTARS